MEKAVEKKSKISFDGHSLLTRIPKVIEKEAGLKKGDHLLWNVKGKKLGVKKDE